MVQLSYGCNSCSGDTRKRLALFSSNKYGSCISPYFFRLYLSLSPSVISLNIESIRLHASTIISRSRKHSCRMMLNDGGHTQELLHGSTEQEGQAAERQPQLSGRLVRPRAGGQAVTQRHIQIDQDKGQADQEQSQGRIARRGARTDLVHLPVTRFNAEALSVQLKDLAGGTPIGQSGHRVGKPFHTVPSIFALRVTAPRHRLDRVGAHLSTGKGVGGRVAARAVEQLPHTAGATTDRDRDHVVQAPSIQRSKDFDAAKAFVQIH